jgi:predicted RNase H-like nuclease (RuvC/YqgF family)
MKDGGKTECVQYCNPLQGGHAMKYAIGIICLAAIFWYMQGMETSSPKVDPVAVAKGKAVESDIEQNRARIDELESRINALNARATAIAHQTAEVSPRSATASRLRKEQQNNSQAMQSLKLELQRELQLRSRLQSDKARLASSN